MVLGTAAINSRPALAWEPNHKIALLAWVSEEAGEMRLRFASVGSSGSAMVNRPLDIPVRRPSQPKLWCDGAGGIHLFWLDSRQGQETTLYHAPIDPQGDIVSTPHQVPHDGSAIAGYAITQVMADALDLFWSDGSQPSARLYHARMPLRNQDGVHGQVMPAVEGAMPAAVADSEQRIHLVWHGTRPNQGDGIAYGRYDPLANSLSEPLWIATVPAGTLYPPEIGLDWQYAYVLWSQERRGGGGGRASAETHCRSLSLGQPGPVEDCQLDIPVTDRPRYAPTEGELNYHSLAPLGAVGPEGLSDYSYMPYPVPGQRQELAVVLSTRLVSRQGNGELQIVLAILRGGQAEGYQTAGQTNSASLRPVAMADAEGQVHLAWLDTSGFGAYRIYYATTDPRFRAVANRLTVMDILRALAGRAWNTAAAFSFLPMLLVWLFPPLLWLVVSYLIYPDRDMNTRSGRLWLGGAVILYLATKMLVMPSFLWYAPFLESIPARFQDLFIFGLPGLIALGSFLGMRWLLRRSERKEILYGFGVFAALDAGLSLVLYIPNVIA